MAIESGIVNNSSSIPIISQSGDVILQTLTAGKATKVVSTTGQMTLTPGVTSDISGSTNVSISSDNAAGGSVLFNNGPADVNTWSIDSSGNLIANITTGGYLELGRQGQGIRYRSGSNAVAGTVVVPTTALGSTTYVLLTSQIDGGTPGFLRVSARSVGTSFTITSSNVADTSTVGWVLYTLV